MRVWISRHSAGGSETVAPEEALPLAGDLVVERVETPAGCFTVGQVPDPPSLVCHSRAEATDAARGFARANRVNVWVAEGGVPELTHVYRPGDRLPPATGPKPGAKASC